MNPPLEMKRHSWLCSVMWEGQLPPTVFGGEMTEVEMRRSVLDMALANKHPGQHVYIGIRAVDTDPITFCCE